MKCGCTSFTPCPCGGSPFGKSFGGLANAVRILAIPEEFARLNTERLFHRFVHANDLFLGFVATPDFLAVSVGLGAHRETRYVIPDLSLLRDAHGHGTTANPLSLNCRCGTWHAGMLQGWVALLHDKTHLPHDFDD